MVFCRDCGAEIDEQALFCPRCGAPQQLRTRGDRDRGPRTFGRAVALCLTNYANGNSRAPRSEYWYFTLFTTLVSFGADFADGLWFESKIGVFGIIVSLAFFLPGIAVAIRRLHDVDRSGYWFLLILLPVIGWVILFIWACTRGTRGPNRFGPDPLAGAPEFGVAVAV